MNFPRTSGVLLHPTSLPGPFGIGDFGPEAYKFIDQLEQAGLAYWQILPLGPTGYGDSPYQCFSAFAGNPILVSPELLVAEGLLDQDVVDSWPENRGSVDYGDVLDRKNQMLHLAHQKYK